MANPSVPSFLSQINLKPEVRQRRVVVTNCDIHKNIRSHISANNQFDNGNRQNLRSRTIFPLKGRTICVQEKIDVQLIKKRTEGVYTEKKLTQGGSFRKLLNSLQLKKHANWPSTDAVAVTWMKQEMLLKLRSFEGSCNLCNNKQA